MTASCVGWSRDDERLASPRDVARPAPTYGDVVGGSAALAAVMRRIEKVAPTDSTVLLTGETGTGKELMARAIHRRSRRCAKPFVAINCGAIPTTLIAAELFGHERGAFTGALQRRLGRFELAQGGTVFLDEIGELPPEAQVALLRVVQERELERIGGTRPVAVDVRIIAATNRELEDEVAAGRFRSDLFYRLNVFPIVIPPLRERRGDIRLLAEHFLDHYARRAGKTFHAIGRETLELLEAYSWPGNVRELQNVIERSVILCEPGELTVDPAWLARDGHRAARPRGALAETLVAQERAMIEAALAETGGRVAGRCGAAARLGLPPSTLDSRIRALGIAKDRFKTAAAVP